MYKFTVRQPGLEAMHFHVDGDEAVIGRSSDCDVVVRHPYVSKRHVRVLAGVVVIDLASSNGTFISGERIKRPVILTGDRIQLGKTDADVTVEVEYVDENAVGPDSDPERLLRARDREIRALRSELERLAANQSDPAELEELRVENKRLRRELTKLELASDGSEGVEARLQRLESLLARAESSSSSATHLDALLDPSDTLKRTLPKEMFREPLRTEDPPTSNPDLNR